MDLLSEWKDWTPGKPPYMLDADRETLESERSKKATITFKSWKKAFTDEAFCRPGDKKLHLGLLPQPFIGDISRASIYVLSLNPGWGPHDYFGEYKVPEYRAALLANLKQRFDGTDFPFLLLDPRYSWGFRYWHRKLSAIILELSKKWEVSFADARRVLASQLASIELVPYHSPTFHDGGGWLKRCELESVRLARTFVGEVAYPRVMAGDAIMIVLRKEKFWNLSEKPNKVIIYRGPQAQGAHLTPKSEGGAAILKVLEKLDPGKHSPKARAGSRA